MCTFNIEIVQKQLKAIIENIHISPTSLSLTLNFSSHRLYPSSNLTQCSLLSRTSTLNFSLLLFYSSIRWPRVVSTSAKLGLPPAELLAVNSPAYQY